MVGLALLIQPLTELAQLLFVGLGQCFMGAWHLQLALTTQLGEL